MLLMLTLLLGPAAVSPLDLSLELNLTFEPRTWTLTWNCLENVTVTRCNVTKADGRPSVKFPRVHECRCRFHALLLHRGLRFDVHAAVNQSVIHRTLTYVNEGAAGTAAWNLSCFIHVASAMSCAWEPGPAAPRDVTYRMFLRDARGSSNMECPQYLGDSVIRTGCHVQNLSRLPSDVYILVTGSSEHAAVQLLDAMFNIKEIEQLSAPDNITVGCNSSHCRITWSRPRTWARLTFQDFRYELDLQRENVDPGGRIPPVSISGDEENKYDFPSPQPRPKLTLRIRAGDVRSDKWSPWSPEVTFGPEEEWRFPQLLVYMAAVLGTVLCALGLGFACKRVLRTQWLFPPIPRIKDKVTNDGTVSTQTLGDDFPTLSQKGNVEDVVTVEEVAPA